MKLFLFIGIVLSNHFIVVSEVTPQDTVAITSNEVVVGNLRYTLTDSYTKNKNHRHISENKQVSTGRYILQENSPWNLDRIDQRNTNYNSKYYSHILAGTGVWNYVIDSGIWTKHEEFEGRAIWGPNFIDDQGEDDCLHFHGTHVAGIIGSKTYGVAKNTTLVSVKVLNCYGSGSVWAVIQGIAWVIQQPLQKKVINLSVIAALDGALNSIIKQATETGTVVVAAAGNSNSDACNNSPSSASEAITVGSVDHSGEISWFSNWGSCVDIFAPGTRIMSTLPNNNIGLAAGTSMAAPHVAGVASLIIDGYRGTVNVTKVHEFIKYTSSKGKMIGDTKNSPNSIVFSLASFV